MTCKERLAADKPCLTETELGYILKEACPDDYGYLPEPSYCHPFTKACEHCWERDIENFRELTTEELLKRIVDKNEEICRLRSQLYMRIGQKIMDDFINGVKRKG